jgi:hypothetical protein
MKPRSPAVVFATLTVALVAALAADVPNFSGEWKMNTARSDFGGVPAPDVFVRSVKHKDPSLEITTHQKGARGESTTELKYTTDGKPAVNTIRGAEAKGTARWEGERLVIESWLPVQGIEIKGKETWALSDGGKTLTIRNHTSIPQQGEFEQTLVLERQ